MTYVLLLSSTLQKSEKSREAQERAHGENGDCKNLLQIKAEIAA
jgi:hypothetical protein